MGMPLVVFDRPRDEIYPGVRLHISRFTHPELEFPTHPQAIC